MIILNTEKIDGYLKSLGRNKKWLSDTLGISQSFLTQVLRNRCKIPLTVMEKFLLLGFKFEEIFIIVPGTDDREFYGKNIHINNELLDDPKYQQKIKLLLK